MIEYNKKKEKGKFDFNFFLQLCIAVKRNKTIWLL